MKIVRRLVQFLCILDDIVLNNDLVLFQPLQLVGSGEHTGIPDIAAAGHGSAGIDQLTVQCNDTQAVAVVLGHADRIRKSLCNDGPAKQICNDSIILSVIGNKIICQSHETFFLSGKIRLNIATNDIDGKERGTTGIFSFQKLDCTASVILSADDNILHRPAHGGFNGKRVLVFRFDQAGNRSVNALEHLMGCFLHDGTYGI